MTAMIDGQPMRKEPMIVAAPRMPVSREDRPH
jgi:hypothetical protein